MVSKRDMPGPTTHGQCLTYLLAIHQKYGWPHYPRTNPSGTYFASIVKASHISHTLIQWEICQASISLEIPQALNCNPCPHQPCPITKLVINRLYVWSIQLWPIPKVLTCNSKEAWLISPALANLSLS